MNCDHIAALEVWRDLIAAIDHGSLRADDDLCLIIRETDLRNDALTTRPAGPENALALLTLCGEHVKRCGERLSEDEFEAVCNASDTALSVMHGVPE